MTVKEIDVAHNIWGKRRKQVPVLFSIFGMSLAVTFLVACNFVDKHKVSYSGS